jgi:hypothetical protein
MKSPYQFIVEPLYKSRYNNTKNISGLDVILNTSEEDHRFSSREAKVISTPINYCGPIEQGDILLVHHNVFKFYNDMYGNRKSGKSFLKDNTFLVDFEQFYAYKKNNKWYAFDRYCFISPIPVEESYIYKPITHEPLMATMEMPNEYLKSQGIKKGDKITFRPDNEYEFIVDGKKMYRSFDHQIVAKL